jgi:hypothetical protein
MKFLIFINFIIILNVYSNNIKIEIKNTSFTSDECNNNLNFNFSLKNPIGVDFENITGNFLNETLEEFNFTCYNISAKDETLICKFDEPLENGNYTFSKFNNITNDDSSDSSDSEITLNYAKNYALIDEILTQNQTIHLDHNHFFKIIFQTMNVEGHNYIIELVNPNTSEKYNFTEKNITCNFGIMYINLNLIGNNNFSLTVNQTKNFSVNIINPCYKRENFKFNITLNRSCENCTIESELLSNQPNYTNPFFDESFNIFKSNFSLILNILLLLFI